MGVRTWIESWPVYRQLTRDDPLGHGAAASSAYTRGLRPRTDDADEVAVCRCRAVGSGQNVHVKDRERGGIDEATGTEVGG